MDKDQAMKIITPIPLKERHRWTMLAYSGDRIDVIDCIEPQGCEQVQQGAVSCVAWETMQFLRL
jgi:hypothetical protein